MCNGTVILCGHCRRPIIQGVGMSVHAGGQSFHYECVRSPYVTNEQVLKEKNSWA